MPSSLRVTFAPENGVRRRTSGPVNQPAASRGKWLRHTRGLRIEIPKNDEATVPKYVRPASPWPGDLSKLGPIDDSDDVEAEPGKSRDDEQVDEPRSGNHSNAVRGLRHGDPFEEFDHLDPVTRQQARRARRIRALQHSGNNGYNDYLHWAKRHPGEYPRHENDKCGCKAKKRKRASVALDELPKSQTRRMPSGPDPRKDAAPVTEAGLLNETGGPQEITAPAEPDGQEIADPMWIAWEIFCWVYRGMVLTIILLGMFYCLCLNLALLLSL